MSEVTERLRKDQGCDPQNNHETPQRRDWGGRTGAEDGTGEGKEVLFKYP